MTTSASPFAQWLAQQLTLRRMSQAEFCRLGDISPGMVSQFLVGQRGAGEGLYRAVSAAFGMPMTDVLRIAGLIPPDEGKSDYSAEDAYILQLLSRLTAEDKSLIFDFIKMVEMRRRRRGDE